MTLFSKQSLFMRQTLSVFAVACLIGATLLITTSSNAFAATTSVENGDTDELTVPSGITSIDYVVVGGNGEQGEGVCGGFGGEGAYMTGTLAVTPGDTITIIAGRNGDDSAQYGGEGGLSGVSEIPDGGHGGDASYIYLNGELKTDIVVAAAGGGGGGGKDGNCGSEFRGNGGGAIDSSTLDGMDGEEGQEQSDEGNALPGSGATTSAVGAGGPEVNITPVAGDAGSDMNGGDGGITSGTPASGAAGGGGGGAGYFGGGGGAAGLENGGGGGAGSSYIDEEVISDSELAQADGATPAVTLTYEVTEESSTSSTSTTTSTTTPTYTPPNDGDGNDDGIVDSEQSNVHTVLTGVGGFYGDMWVTFVHPESCDFDSGSVSGETDFEAQDSKYEYPSNFFGFEIECSQPTVSVTMYFHNVPGTAKDYIPRKYLSYNNSYVTIEGASVEDVTIDSKNVVKVTYSITDGGIYDNDQTVNGTILDPASIAYSPVSGTLATTGDNVYAVLIHNICSTYRWSIINNDFQA